MKSALPKIVGALLNSIGVFNSKLASRLALQVFSKPRKGKLTPNANSFLDNATKSTLYYTGFPIQVYHWKGLRETILLAHGWESNSNRWRKEVKKLTNKGYNVVALDAPAHGGSGSSDFNALLYSEFIHVVSLKFKPTIVIGHSVGAMALVFSLRKYETKTVKKALLLGAPSNFKDILKRYTDMMGYSRLICRGIEKQIEEKFGQPASHYSTAKFVENLKIKGLIVHDEKDTIIPYSDAIEINTSFKNATFITTKGLGHSLKGDYVSEEIIKFLSH